MNAKKNIKNKSKQTRKDLKYREKPMITEWSCQVCGSLNDQINVYCVNCLQNLYYYNYINKHMFVEKDESYMYANEPIQIKRKYSTHSWATNDTACEDDLIGSDDECSSTKASQQPSFKWVDSLLQ